LLLLVVCWSRFLPIPYLFLLPVVIAITYNITGLLALALALLATVKPLALWLLVWCEPHSTSTRALPLPNANGCAGRGQGQVGGGQVCPPSLCR
jgi:hypothetical protein